MSRPRASLPLVAVAVLAAGCDFLGDFQWTPDVQLIDDGATLWISADPEGDPALAQLAITVDGIRHVVSVQPDFDPPLPPILCLFCGIGPLKLALPSPANREVEIELNGAFARVTLPAAFAVEVSATHLERTSTRLILAYALLPTADPASVMVSSACGEQKAIDLLSPDAPGIFRIDLTRQVPAAWGPCTHELHVMQRLPDADEALQVGLVRLEGVLVTSVP